jgi:hypothetical protein
MAGKKANGAKTVLSLKTDSGGKVLKKPRATRAKSPRTSNKSQKVPEATATTSTASILGLVDTPARPQLKTEDLATRAYFYWLERGCPTGSPEQDWFRAEEELRTILSETTK